MIAYCNGCDKVVAVGEEVKDTIILIKDTVTEQIDHELVFEPIFAETLPFDMQLTRSPFALYLLYKEKRPFTEDEVRIYYIPSITASAIEIQSFEYMPSIDYAWNLDSVMFVADNPAGSVALLVKGTTADVGKYEIAQFEITAAGAVSDHLNYVNSFELKSDQNTISGIARASSGQNVYAMAGWELDGI